MSEHSQVVQFSFNDSGSPVFYGDLRSDFLEYFSDSGDLFERLREEYGLDESVGLSILSPRSRGLFFPEIKQLKVGSKGWFKKQFLVRNEEGHGFVKLDEKQEPFLVRPNIYTHGDIFFVSYHDLSVVEDPNPENVIMGAFCYAFGTVLQRISNPNPVPTLDQERFLVSQEEIFLRSAEERIVRSARRRHFLDQLECFLEYANRKLDEGVMKAHTLSLLDKIYQN